MGIVVELVLRAFSLGLHHHIGFLLTDERFQATVSTQGDELVLPGVEADVAHHADHDVIRHDDFADAGTTGNAQRRRQVRRAVPELDRIARRHPDFS
ncbi:hypothetical protein D3C72_2297900 [compost metagenome]